MTTTTSIDAPPYGPPPPWAPVARPAWERLDVAPTPRLALLALAVGVVGDLAVRSGGATVAGALLVAAAVGALAASGRIVNSWAWLPLGAAPLAAAVLLTRTSTWITVPAACSAAACMWLGASLARRGSLARLPARELALRATHAVGQWALAPGIVRVLPPGADSRGLWRRAVPVVRGVLVAAPVVVVFAALLGSADTVFASLVAPDIDGGAAFVHVLLVAVVGWLALGLLRTASTEEEPTGDLALPTAPRTEASIVLGAVVLLFGAFVATQVFAAAGGADHILDTAGLTRAEYARTGFFQLLWVAGLTLAGLGVASAVCNLDGPSGRRLRRLVVAVVALAVGIVAVAVVRLDLYRDAYGWTMLRLSCTAFACWLGVVLVLAGVSMAGPKRIRGTGWVVPASLAAGLAVLLGLSWSNPEALVARSNLAGAATVPVDVEYLATLGDDALPAIESALDQLPAAERDVLLTELCDPWRPDDTHTGWASWNLSTARAESARARLCG